MVLLIKKGTTFFDGGKIMKRLSLALTIGWIFFIFYQGTRIGEVSMNKSNEIVDQILNVVEKPLQDVSLSTELVKDRPKETITKEDNQSLQKLKDTLSYSIRKGAHLFEYLVLSMLLYKVFNFYSISKRDQIIYTLSILLLCAVLDEFFQSFVQRTSSVQDVLLDLGGGIVGLTMITGIAVLKNEFSNSESR